jgi:hypothetical protein
MKTICSVLRGLRTKIDAHMANRGVGIKDRALEEIDEALSMAKRMNDKLIAYRGKHGNNSHQNDLF